MSGVHFSEMVEKRGQPFYLIELKLYLISKSIAKALDLREERGVRISQRRGPLGRRIVVIVVVIIIIVVVVLVVVVVVVVVVVIVILVVVVVVTIIIVI